MEMSGGGMCLGTGPPTTLLWLATGQCFCGNQYGYLLIFLFHHLLQGIQKGAYTAPRQVGEKDTFTDCFHLGQGVIRPWRKTLERENSSFGDEVPGGESVKQIWEMKLTLKLALANVGNGLMVRDHWFSLSGWWDLESPRRHSPTKFDFYEPPHF